MRPWSVYRSGESPFVELEKSEDTVPEFSGDFSNDRHLYKAAIRKRHKHRRVNEFLTYKRCFFYIGHANLGYMTLSRSFNPEKIHDKPDRLLGQK